ncbi:zinc dependent phospholipase C family protein [Gordonibacter massiliensis (ex Traore et al. 2017)]|uniref:zinc dependent phospholipase C family protein n=1 Tax=Gordonibacter massiliensis (ex Traore et al. 2017) TaxID=1841863 RepID=UPI001FE755C4|nr:zinc dependent phospholipase C family protein [Gordonibacter massiliensis (ex Traore et al. 2017)]
MPALITHDFFGQDVYDRLFRDIGGTRDEAQAFLLGNQGPDPLFYAVVDPRLREHNRLGNIMHSEKPSELIKAFKDSLGILGEDELPVGRAYALGFLCHYTLDSTMHPLVFFHEYRLCDAGEPGLSRADGHEVHAVIESELDELVLFAKRGETVATFQPWREILQASDFALDVISKMYSYVALTVYGRIVPPSMFAQSVRSFRRVQRLFYSKTGAKRAAIGRVEQLVRPFSFYQSMSHRPVELTESAYDNRAHEAWENPYTGEASTAGFWDLFDEALEKALANIAAFDRDDFDLEDARELTGELDFSGRPVVATLVSVEDGVPTPEPNDAPERGDADGAPSADEPSPAGA